MKAIEKFDSYKLSLRRPAIDVPDLISRDVRNLIQDIWLLNRVSNSDEMEKAQQRVIEYCNVFLRGQAKLHHFDAGSEHNYWLVPPRWEAKQYWLKGPDGKVIDSLASNPLALCPYSHSTHERLSLKELQKKLVIHPSVPSAYAYFGHRMYRHWTDGWNISLPRDKADQLAQGEYEVFIDSAFSDIPMPVFEYFLQGETDQTIALVGHICHPGQVNDSVSGCMALLQALSHLEQNTVITKYSYRLLFVPEVFGSVFYLCNCAEAAAKIKFVLCANMTSHDAPLTMCKSKRQNSLLDIAMETAIRDGGEPFDIGKFGQYPDCGDEIVFDSTGYGIPSVSFSRNGESFRHYHSSADTIDEFLSLDCQRRHQKFCAVILDALLMMEKNFSMSPKFRGAVCLSNPRLNLYLSPSNVNNSKFKAGQMLGTGGEVVDLRYFMEFFLDSLSVDGISPLEIAHAANMPFWPVFNYASDFVERGLADRATLTRTNAYPQVSNLPLNR